MLVGVVVLHHQRVLHHERVKHELGPLAAILVVGVVVGVHVRVHGDHACAAAALPRPVEACPSPALQGVSQRCEAA